MKKAYLLFFVFTLFLGFGCQEKPGANTGKQNEVKQFTPPVDGKIMESQKQAYIKASFALKKAMDKYSEDIKGFIDKNKVNPDLSQMSDTTFLKAHPEIQKAWKELNLKWNDMQKEAYKTAGIAEEEFNWIGGALTDTINADVQKDVEKALTPESEEKKENKEDKGT